MSLGETGIVFPDSLGTAVGRSAGSPGDSSVSSGAETGAPPPQQHCGLLVQQNRHLVPSECGL